MPAHPDLLAAFSAGLRDGALPPGLTARLPDEAARRFAVYRNNVTVSLIEALGKRFPVIARLVGEEFFAAMARIYAETHRPQSPVLLAWGETFPAFLAGFPPLAAYPYMADVARIEVARGRAFHAADATPVAPGVLIAAAADPGAARIALHPSVQVLRLDHPAVSIWAANQPGVTPAPITATGAEVALILRDASFNVPVTAMSPGDAAFADQLLSGAPLLTAAEVAQWAEPGHDPQALLIRLMQAGCIVTPPEEPAR